MGLKVNTLPDGSASAPALAFADNTNTGIYSHATNSIALSCGGTASMTLAGSGTGVNITTTPFIVGTSAVAGRLIVQGRNGGFWEFGTNSEVLTLATGSTTTDTVANLLPANAIIEAVNYRVTTAITTAVSFSIGDASTAGRFVSGATGVSLGSTGAGLLQWSGGVATDAAGPLQVSSAKVRVTTNANPGAGAIRIEVFYRVFALPTS